MQTPSDGCDGEEILVTDPIVTSAPSPCDTSDTTCADPDCPWCNLAWDPTEGERLPSGRLRRTVSAEQHREILRLAALGTSNPKIALLTGVSQPYVWTLLSRAGVPAHRKATSMDRRAQVLELFRNGGSTAAIGAIVGLSTSTVLSILRANGLATAHSSKRKLAVDESAKILAMGRAGVSVVEITRSTGLAVNTIYKRLRAAGVPTVNPACEPISTLKKAQILRMARNGSSTGDIVALTKAAFTTVTSIFDANGVPRNHVARPTSAIDRTRALRLHASGHSTNDIASRLGRSHSWAYSIVKGAVKSKRTSAKDFQRIVTLGEGGMSCADIARRLDRSMPTVYLVLRKAKAGQTAPRSRWDRQK
jgi:DNA-binding CsgD family transcriptional regulator